MALLISIDELGQEHIIDGGSVVGNIYPGDGTITIKDSNNNIISSFTLNQATDTTITLPDSSGTSSTDFGMRKLVYLTLKQGGNVYDVGCDGVRADPGYDYYYICLNPNPTVPGDDEYQLTDAYASMLNSHQEYIDIQRKKYINSEDWIIKNMIAYPSGTVPPIPLDTTVDQVTINTVISNVEQIWEIFNTIITLQMGSGAGSITNESTV